MKSMKLKDGKTIITFPDKIYSDDELVELWAAVGWTHVPRRERDTIAEISQIEPDGYYIAMDGEYIVAHCGWVNRGDIFQTCGTKVSKGYKFRSYKGEGISNVLRQKRLKVIGSSPAMAFMNYSSEGWLNSWIKEGWELGSIEDLPQQYHKLVSQLSDVYQILILNIKSKAMKKAWEILKTPFRGTTKNWYDKAIAEGKFPARPVEKKRKGVWGGNPKTAFGYSISGSRNNPPIVHFISHEGFEQYAGDSGYYPFDIPIENSREVWRGITYTEWEAQKTKEYHDAMDKDELPLPPIPNWTRYRNAMEKLFKQALEQWVE